MFRIIFSTDHHVKGTNFAQRKDFFPETVLAKLSCINDMAKQYKADLHLMGGDVLDIPGVAPSVVTSIQNVLKASPAPIYSVIGNHCVFGNPDDISKLPIGNLMSSGLVNRIQGTLDFSYPDNLSIGCGPIAITGQDATYGLDRDGSIAEYCPARPENALVHIHVVHGWLSDKPVMETIPHTMIDAIVNETQADIILTGHEHTGYGIIKRTNAQGKEKIFINPGAVSRVKASLEEYFRMPAIALIEIDDDGKIDARILQIPIAKPGEEVIDRETLEHEIERSKIIEKFSDGLKEFTVESGKTIDESIRDFAKQSGVPDDVVLKALEMVLAAQSIILEETAISDKE